MIRLVAFALESAISAQLALFAAYLLSSRARAPALYVLAGLSAALAAMIAGNLMIGATGWPWLGDVVLFLDLLAPPLVYLYVRQMRHPASQLRLVDVVHALPAALGLAAWKANLLSSMDVYVIGCWTAYLAAAAYHFLHDRANYASAALRRFIVGLLSVLATTLALRVVMSVEAAQGRPFLEGVPYLLVLAGAFLVTCQIIFTSLRYPGLLSIPGSHVKYARSTADATDLKALEQRFETLFRDRRPYLDPDLTPDALAGMLGAPARHVSQLVNARYGMNLASYINQCRIREVAHLLTTEPEKPIKVVMFECGFKSKSIFNREFQRCLGTSPSQFRAKAEAE